MNNTVHKQVEIHARTEGYPLFDWLRFVLASVVVLVHAKVIGWEQSGNLAVQVFFALSGFLIGGILLKSKTSDLPRFFFNRASRIWIPYFCAIVALYAVSTIRDPINLRWLEFLFYDLTFTHNWFSLLPDATTALEQMPLQGTGNHFWSIGAEEQFYLVAPIIIVVLGLGRNAVFWIVAAGLLAFAGQTDFASISLGVAAARLNADRTIPAWMLLVVAVAAASAMGFWAASYQYAAPLFAISAVLLCARQGVRGRIGEFMGGVSYPMYLNHWVGAFIAHGIAKRVDFIPPLAQGLLSYVLGVGSGVVAYLLVDRIVLQRRNSFYTKGTGITLAITAYLIVSVGLMVGFILT